MLARLAAWAVRALVLSLLFTACVAAEPIELVDWAIEQPSGYFDPRRPPVQLPDFSLIPTEGFRKSWLVSPPSYERLRAERDGVVEEVRVRIKSIIPGSVAAELRAQAGEQGYDAGDVLETYLEILLDLNGTEAMPELLQLEAALDRAADYQVRFGYTLHQEVLSVIVALKGVSGPIPYTQTQRDQIISKVESPESELNDRAASSLMDEVLNFPGAWEQVCQGWFSRPGDWLPLYGFRREWHTLFISDENFARLRDERQAVVRELQLRVPGHRDRTVRRATHHDEWDYQRALETYLVIVQDLNAVETLPQLLQLEEALNQVAVYDAPGPISEPCEHVEVLSTISLLLRNENAAGWQDLKAGYHKSSRDRIVATARHFREVVPPSEYRASAAITPEFRYR